VILVAPRPEEPFAITATGGHVPVVHLAPVETMETDFVAVAVEAIASAVPRVRTIVGGITSVRRLPQAS
jgi:hypothetical protein